MSKKNTVYIVHCIDTEGPMFESLEATFERIRTIFGIAHLSPTKENLVKLQNQQIHLEGLEKEISKVVDPKLINYNDTYQKIDNMLNHIGSKSFRMQYPDSTGKGWVYNWHCVDHLNYISNVRRKDIGMHNIFDHYQRFVQETKSRDGVHWHYHPSHYRGISHLSATYYLRDTKFFDILCRRILDRNWFPSVNRAGFHTERPDSHWLLEQWLPFDISNQSISQRDEQLDLANGRFGDWRRAPADWSIYNPSHDDYQAPGNCRRWIARCLNVGTRHKCINQHEVNKAFSYAQDHGSCLMAFTNHDFRDIASDVVNVIEMIKQARKEFPNVNFQYMEAREAMNMCIFGDYKEPSKNILSVSFSKNQANNPVMTVKADQPTFGPQPFLAIETTDGSAYHDNLDFQEPFREWSYTFDEHSFEWKAINRIGLGTNDLRGFPHVQVINPLKVVL